MRAYLFSALTATLAGLMNVAQDKGITSQYGQGAELIVIAAVIVGGASIAGGRGRVIGACMGAALVVLLHTLLDFGGLVLGKHHYLLFWLAVAMQPRMCMLLDHNLDPIKTQVRVGTAVDTVGQVKAAAALVPRFC
jgi:predicted ABC-type sugar transport system permease subunit